MLNTEFGERRSLPTAAVCAIEKETRQLGAVTRYVTDGIWRRNSIQHRNHTGWFRAFDVQRLGKGLPIIFPTLSISRAANLYQNSPAQSRHLRLCLPRWRSPFGGHSWSFDMQQISPARFHLSEKKQSLCKRKKKRFIVYY